MLLLLCASSARAAPASGCVTSANCNWHGQCNASKLCACAPGWTGPSCAEVSWAAGGATIAFEDKLWTWGGSPIRGEDGLVHMFASELTNDCGILHYCSNSRVIHLTASNPLGPFTFQGVALSPRNPPAWDSGAVHGPTVHRIPGSDEYALYYMGTSNTWDPANGTHPNCTSSYDAQQGSRATRRIGVATSKSLSGPWLRRDAPIFGPGNASAGDFDYTDVSNPTPILFQNGSVVLLYKGRGHVQTMGVATAPHFDGPFTRLAAPLALPYGVEDTWGWIESAPAAANSANGADGADRGRVEVLHVLAHSGNGATSAGAHGYSTDGISWTWSSSPAYTGMVRWSNGSSSVLARRERPQVLLTPASGERHGSSYGLPEVICTSAQALECPHDGGPGTTPCRTFTMCAAVAGSMQSR